MNRIRIRSIPITVCQEKKHIYLRYLRDNISKPFNCDYHKGDIVRYDLTNRQIYSVIGFAYEETCCEEVTNVEKLLLDAGKIPFKEVT